jgi:Concanavalin A-like lectin/glucanases superfamily
LSFRPNKPFRTIIDDLGLSTGLQLCLDAGDIQSYDGTSQTWVDRGQGNDFFRGTTSGAEASDPTFNGVAGALTENEYFSFDGGDFFRYTTTNPNWIQSFHKGGATFTIAMWVRLPSIGSGLSGEIFSNLRDGAGVFGTGILLAKTIAGNFQFLVYNAGVIVKNTSVSLTSFDNKWFFFGLSLNEADAVSGRIFIVDRNVLIGSGTYTAPASVDATATTEIGAGGNGFFPLESGDQMAAFMVWNRALSATELQSIYQYPGVSFSTEDSPRTVKRVVGY